jgi:hypothetical protein
LIRELLSAFYTSSDPHVVGKKTFENIIPLAPNLKVNFESVLLKTGFA